MYYPGSTYRVQLHKDFTLKNLLAIVDYLHALGIKTIYTSPILSSTTGSTHGYDVTDPWQIDPEIGTMQQLRALATQLKERNMGLLQDIVPNHMAFNPQNTWLMDVLERGKHSPYYNYFDVDWNHPDETLKGKLMTPFLGKELQQCIKDGEVKLRATRDGVTVNYFDTAYPLSIIAYDYLIQRDETGTLWQSVSELISQAFASHALHDWHYKRRTTFAMIPSDALQHILDRINGNIEEMLKILDKQWYVLTYWKTAQSKINYRRFFTVTSLICLRMEDEAVFQEYHRFLLWLYQQKIIQGIRVDHIDGLFNPTEYLVRLRNFFGEDAYIVAEKILEAHERLPSYWPLQGTSGYEFLAHVSQLFTDRIGARSILGFYHALVPGLPTYRELVKENKAMILEHHLAGEWDNLTRYFFDLNLAQGFHFGKMKNAIGACMLGLSVYRIYPDAIPLRDEERIIFIRAFDVASQIISDGEEELRYLKELFIGSSGSAIESENVLAFIRRMMQFTGPLTAKGVEDTTFYVYNALLSHDEVGDAPSTLGITIEQFHERMVQRLQDMPLSLNATATHDTKRGEDARLRLNALCELSDEWKKNVKHWLALAIRLQRDVHGRIAPDTNEVYFILQSLVANFPEDLVLTEEFLSRLRGYLTKAMREAKVNTTWESPDEEYEKAIFDFLDQLVADDEFIKPFIAFTANVMAVAATYSLGQTLIKCTAPGIPDVYQGTELWDLSFVDPDNRRPVMYDQRKKFMTLLLNIDTNHPDGPIVMRDHVQAGLMKMFVLREALQCRNQQLLLFQQGNYVPLRIAASSPCAVAYARVLGKAWAIVVVPVNITNNVVGELILPDHAPHNWWHVFMEEVTTLDRRVPLQLLFEKFPVALFLSRD